MGCLGTTHFDSLFDRRDLIADKFLVGPLLERGKEEKSEYIGGEIC